MKKVDPFALLKNAGNSSTASPSPGSKSIIASKNPSMSPPPRHLGDGDYSSGESGSQSPLATSSFGHQVALLPSASPLVENLSLSRVTQRKNSHSPSFGLREDDEQHSLNASGTFVLDSSAMSRSLNASQSPSSKALSLPQRQIDLKTYVAFDDEASPMFRNSTSTFPQDVISPTHGRSRAPSLVKQQGRRDSVTSDTKWDIAAMMLEMYQSMAFLEDNYGVRAPDYERSPSTAPLVARTRGGSRVSFDENATNAMTTVSVAAVEQHGVKSPPQSKGGSFAGTDQMLVAAMLSQGKVIYAMQAQLNMVHARQEKTERELTETKAQLREVKIELAQEKFTSQFHELSQHISTLVTVAKNHTKAVQSGAELHAILKDPYKSKLYDAVLSALSAFYTAAAALSTGLMEISQTGSALGTAGSVVGAIGEGMKALAAVPLLGTVLSVIGSICTAINSVVVLQNCANFRQLATTQTEMDVLAKEFAIACVERALDSRKLHNADTVINTICTEVSNAATNIFGNFVPSTTANAAKAGEDDGAILAALIIWGVIDKDIRNVQELNARVLKHYRPDTEAVDLDPKTVTVKEILEENSSKFDVVKIITLDRTEYKHFAVQLLYDGHKVPYKGGLCCNSPFKPTPEVKDAIKKHLIADIKAKVIGQTSFGVSLDCKTIDEVADAAIVHALDERTHHGIKTLCQSIAAEAERACNLVLRYREHPQDKINPLALKPFEKPQSASCCGDAPSRKNIPDDSSKAYKNVAHGMEKEAAVSYKPGWCGKTLITLTKEIYMAAAKHLAGYIKDIITASKMQPVTDSKHLHDDTFIDGIVCRAIHEADKQHYGTKDFCNDAAQRVVWYCNATIGLEEDAATALAGSSTEV